MQSRSLRERVALQSATEALDSHGQPKKTWSTQATVFASVDPLSGREKEIAHQIAAETNIKVTIRYRADVTPDWRILYRTKYYEIVGAVPPRTIRDQRNGLVLYCREIA